MVTNIDDFFDAYRSPQPVISLIQLTHAYKSKTTMPYAGSDNALYYEDQGHGYPIVFIPGFGGVGSFWRNQVAFFRQRFRVITVDQRGAGSSQRTQQDYSIKQMTEDVQAVMDAAGLRTVVLVGHSTGGAIAQTLASWSPERVSGMLLSSTWCKPSRYFRRVFEFRRSLLEIGATDLFHKAGVFFRYPPDYAEANDSAFDGSGPVDIDITISRINAILGSDMSRIAPQLHMPTVVVAARDDCLIPMYMSDEVAKRIAKAKYVVLDRGGHFLPETRSDAYNSVLDTFLAGLDLKSGPTVRPLRSSN